jgi:hypothetical protein
MDDVFKLTPPAELETMGRKQKLCVALGIIVGICQLAANHHPLWGRPIQSDVIETGYVIEFMLIVWSLSGRQKPKTDS